MDHMDLVGHIPGMKLKNEKLPRGPGYLGKVANMLGS